MFQKISATDFNLSPAFLILTEDDGIGMIDDDFLQPDDAPSDMVIY